MADQENPIIKDWRGLFPSKSSDSMEYFEPSTAAGKIIVKPPQTVVDEGALKWKCCLVGQFVVRPLPFPIVKLQWKNYGNHLARLKY